MVPNTIEAIMSAREAWMYPVGEMIMKDPPVHLHRSHLYKSQWFQQALNQINSSVALKTRRPFWNKDGQMEVMETIKKWPPNYYWWHSTPHFTLRMVDGAADWGGRVGLAAMEYRPDPQGTRLRPPPVCSSNSWAWEDVAGLTNEVRYQVFITVMDYHDILVACTQAPFCHNYLSDALGFFWGFFIPCCPWRAHWCLHKMCVSIKSEEKKKHLKY